MNRRLNLRPIAGKKVSTRNKRWFKDVGLGFKTPPEAINGHYVGAHVVYLGSARPNEERRQEMPIHWRCFDPRAYPDRPCRFDEDDPHDHHPSGLPSFHSKISCVPLMFGHLPSDVRFSIRSIRKTTREPSRSRFTCVPRRFGRCCYSWCVFRYHMVLSCERW